MIPIEISHRLKDSPKTADHMRGLLASCGATVTASDPKTGWPTECERNGKSYSVTVKVQPQPPTP